MKQHSSAQGNEANWAYIIADAIESDLNKLALGKKSNLTFVEDMARLDARLYDPRNVTDLRLSAAWNFADSYFDAAWHGFKDLDGIPWAEATAKLEYIVQCLRNGAEIEDDKVLRYAQGN